ncbi:unnamed protein product [Rotaria socialis]|uniref:Uncharacterized protein n=1 Tax=Rotaria socialis TaxID=392032 RepID=A0A818H240_9BILA|nr:unnamed protein product [Rotaria socialis]
MRYFDGGSLQCSGRNFDSELTRLPRGLGIGVDRTTGQLKASVIQLIYPPTDHIGISQPNCSRLRYYSGSHFHNASQLNTAWRQTIADGKVCGGELARRPEILEYYAK